MADLSFISLRLVLPALVGVAVARRARSSLLVKPQFEAGPADVARGGVVRDPAVWRRVLDEVTTAFDAAGVDAAGPDGLAGARPRRATSSSSCTARRGAAPVPIDLDAAVAEAEEVGTP